MVLSPNTVIPLDVGKNLVIENFVDEGGQGQAYLAKESHSGKQVFCKVFFDKFSKQDTETRTRFLVDLKLNKICPIFKSPLVFVGNGKILGHYADVAEGKTLESILAQTDMIPYTLVDGLQIAIQLAHGIRVLNEMNIAHGDLHLGNLFVSFSKSKNLCVPKLSIIDFDNFRAPKMPLPTCVGQRLFTAPELISAMAQGKRAVPDIQSDLFSLGLLIYEIIMLRHITNGADANEELFQKAMSSQHWPHDPALLRQGNKTLDGYPSEVLNADLSRLVRNIFSGRDRRPTAKEWESNLCRAFHEIYLCPNCNYPSLIDAAKTFCPYCIQPFPHLKIVAENGCAISLHCATVRIGRNELGGSAMISELHAIFHRRGPQTWLEAYGSNGTFRLVGSKWEKLPDYQAIPIKEGDKLKFANLKLSVVADDLVR